MRTIRSNPVVPFGTLLCLISDALLTCYMYVIHLYSVTAWCQSQVNGFYA